ncbi:MAG: iron-sulfur cluster assembly scaffold protein [Pyrinomonadaceae bacterium]|nr:iron-sulfur cluster assembly scaffold protein [Pyrinomonadaceae bacterium]
MSFYPANINERFHAPGNVGTAANANAVGTSATFVCGAALRFTLRIDRETKIILEAKFKTNGCGYLIAAADVLAEKVVGVKLTELHHLDQKILEREIEGELGEFPEARKHCRELAFETLQIAFADFRHAQIEEWTGEKALICTCFGISEETIENLVENNLLETVEEVTAACSAGGGCGSCQPLIQEIIDTTAHEI